MKVTHSDIESFSASAPELGQGIIPMCRVGPRGDGMQKLINPKRYRTHGHEACPAQMVISIP